MKKVLFFVPAFLYYTLIIFLSSRSYQLKVDILFFDKIVHLLEFAILGFLLSFGYIISLNSPLRIKATSTFLTGILLGVLDEIHQYFVPRRSTDILDWVADVAGVLAGLFIFIYLSRKTRAKIWLDKLQEF